MSNGRYILDGHKPVECDDVIEWAKWFESNNRTVAKTKISKDVDVSTVFLGLDHNFLCEDGKPLLFETMIFGGKLDQELWRYSTWEEAEAGHVKAVGKCK